MARVFASVLPTPRTSLLGRERDIAALRDLLLHERSPLVTVTGPGGVGKTRLALAVAAELEAEYDDGVAFVPLAAVRDPELVLPVIARALGLRETAGSSLAISLAAVLRDQHLLLVLDNLEHMTGATAVLGHLLEACPRLQVLATSRIRLRLGAEYLYTIAPLPVPNLNAPLSATSIAANPAVALFCQRARQASPHFQLTADNAATIAAIVVELDGLPLAIELAAARTAMLSPAALLARLDQRLRLLTGGPDDSPPRLRSMLDAIAWSYDLLTPTQQAFLRALAVFAGGFDPDAAAAVCGQDPVSTLEVLHVLADHSLIHLSARSSPDVAGRCTMLETVREFGLDRLREAREEDAVRAAHTAWVVNLTERAQPHLLGPDERAWNDQLDAELGNLRAALTWSLDHDPTQALRIMGASHIFWAWRVPVSEGRRWLDLALEATRGDSAVRMRALTAASLLAVAQGDVQATQDHVSAVMIGGDDVNPVTAGWAISHLSAGAFFTGETGRAMALLDRALPLLATGERPVDRAWAAYSRAWHGLAAAMTGSLEPAIADYEEALRLARAARSDGILLFILDDYAGLLLDAQQLDQARALAVEAMEIATRVNETWLIAHAMLTSASIAAAAGDGVRAALGLGAAHALYLAVGLTMPPPLQQRRDLAVDRARSALGSTAFATEFDHGNANPLAVVSAMLRQEREQANMPLPALTLAFTRRETDVLRLMAAGKTDREIAGTLYISRKTASNHVASILRKVGVQSRAAAAIFAVRAGLV